MMVSMTNLGLMLSADWNKLTEGHAFRCRGGILWCSHSLVVAIDMLNCEVHVHVLDLM
jgi:hypothetical protein